MRLLFVIDCLGSGGAQRQLSLLAREMRKREHEVEIFQYHRQPHFESELVNLGVAIHCVRKQWRFSTGPIFALRKLVRSRAFDALLSFLDTPSFYAELAAIGLSCPLIVSERSALPSPLPLRSRLLREMHRLADHVVVNSYHAREALIAHFPWIAAKSSTILNGVAPSRRAAALETPHDPPHFLVIGRVCPDKNPLGIIRAASYFRSIWGSAPVIRWAGRFDANAEQIEALNSAIDEHDLTRSWTWLGERSDIPDLLRTHDALIHASFYEGLPNSICEALAAGLPVLASSVCDHPFLVEENQRGFLFNPQEPSSIAGAMLRFAGMTPRMRIEMSANARRFADRELSLDRYVRQFEDVLMAVNR